MHVEDRRSYDSLNRDSATILLVDVIIVHRLEAPMVGFDVARVALPASRAKLSTLVRSEGLVGASSKDYHLLLVP